MGSIACGIPAIDNVRFVKLYKPARAKKAVHKGYSLFVLLENGNVATNSPVVRNACFLVGRSSSSFWQFYEVIQAIHSLGVISKKDMGGFRAKYEAAFAKEREGYNAEHFQDTAKKLGITLTPTQKKLLKSRAHSKKMFKRKVPK